MKAIRALYLLFKETLDGWSEVRGTIVLVLVWAYYSIQIILIGAKFTQVYADKYGSKILPSSKAELVIRQPINTR